MPRNAGMEACDVCGGLEKKTEKKLISVCNCYKKHEDSGRMHRECLKAYLVKLSERNEDATRHVCPRCHEPFRVVMTHRFVCDCAHVCTPRALNNMFELVIVGFTLLCCASVFMVLDYDALEREHTSKWLLYGMGLVSLAMVLFTLKKVYGRFRKASSDVFVSEV